MMGLLQAELEIQVRIGKTYTRFVLLGGIPVIQIMLHKSS